MFRLYKPFLAVAAVSALTTAGCGSSDSKSSSTETNANGKTTTNNKMKQKSGDKRKKRAQDPNACGKLGITPDSTKEGTCVQGAGSEKRSVTIVNGDSTLKLKELDVKVSKVSTETSISGPIGTIKPKTEKQKKTGKTIPKTFVVVDLTWKNNDDKAQHLNESGKQLKLQSAGGGGAIFLPGEKNDTDSLYNSKPVKPDKKQKAQAVFQIPTTAAKGIKLRGANPQLAVFEFSTAGKEKQRPNGFIRLWNV
jgi:Domain of unknown function (DUF4352)